MEAGQQKGLRGCEEKIELDDFVPTGLAPVAFALPTIGVRFLAKVVRKQKVACLQDDVLGSLKS